MSDSVENALQLRLTTCWLEHGLIVDGHRLYLLAWEVMTPSWDINSANNGFGEPASDFLFLDISGNLWVVEVKPEIRSAMPSWNVLCQVTFYAVQIERSRAFEKLEKAHEISFIDYDKRRKNVVMTKQALREAHRLFFDLPTALPKSKFGTGPIHRVVAAKFVKPAWLDCLKEFDTMDLKSLQLKVTSVGNGNRFCKSILNIDSLENIEAGVHFLQLDAEA
jgi:hypothetical protein